MRAEQEPILRRPQDQLAGCCWLPRLADKIRAAHRRQLPLLYRLALGSRWGIDGSFLSHFDLTFQTFQQTVHTTSNDEALAQWFTQQAQGTPERIRAWNRFAPQLGKPGHPGYYTRQLFKWILMPKSVAHPVSSLFEAIEQDEQP